MLSSGANIVIILMVILYCIFRRRRKTAVLRKLVEKRKNEGNKEMKKLAERFIEKECIIYAFDSSRQYEGTVKEVTDGAILIERNGKLEAINLDFIIRIREYPINHKTGKKKTLVLD